jgi:iron(III) transport system ATP-binding protein
MKALQVNALKKSFADTQALQDVRLDIEEGHLTAVLGPSGCGKTTLLRCIAGFETPDSGQISINGHKVFNGKTDLPPEKRQVGFVPQEGALFPHLTVEKNVAFGLPRRLKQSGRVQDVLALVNMQGMEKRMPDELSGGQQQRIALARALAPSPPIILLDEPFNALDADLRVSLRKEVRRVLKQAGATGLLVTHDQEEALSMADRIAVMLDGQIVQTSAPTALYRYPANLKVATFLGEATLLPCKVCDGYAECPLGSLTVAKGCPIHAAQATAMIRPEQFEIKAPGEGIEAEVERVTYFGHDALIKLRLSEAYGGGMVSTRVLDGKNYEKGQTVSLIIKGNVMAYSSQDDERLIE